MTESFYAPRFEVRISGLTMAADVTSEVLSVMHDSSLDTADMFEIVFRNPGNRFTDSALFNPGQTIELHMGYGDNLEPMMLGEITSIQPRFPESGGPTISVSGYDKSYKLRHSEPIPRDFKYMNDSMIVAQIAAENLLIPVVDPSPWFHMQKTQSGSDFAFIKELATENFFDAYVHWDKLYFQFPRQTEARVLEWGHSLVSFSPRLSTAALAGLQIIRGYNEALAQAVTGIATGALLSLDDAIERLGPGALDLLASLGRRVIHKQRINSPIGALGFAKALLQDLIEGLYEGSGRCIGIPDLRAGTYVKVAGVGKRFSGSYRLRKVTHSIDSSGYMTEFEITQRAGAALLSLIRKLTDPETISPPDRPQKFYGVAIAKVTKAPQISPDPDPTGLLGARVKVSLPWLSDSHESAWARVMTPAASSGSGMYFMPDEDDMVIVAFQDGDLSMPVVLGGVWDGPARPPVYPPLQNTVRMIKSKSGHTITLDDTPAREAVTIKSKSSHAITLDDTPTLEKMSIASKSGHVVTLDDTPMRGQVTVTSKSGHAVTLDDTPSQEKVTIKSKSGHSIVMDDTPSQATITIEHPAGSKITLKPDGSISFDAATIEFSAETDISLVARKNINLKAEKVLVSVRDHMDVS